MKTLIGAMLSTLLIFVSVNSQALVIERKQNRTLRMVYASDEKVGHLSKAPTGVFYAEAVAGKYKKLMIYTGGRSIPRLYFDLSTIQQTDYEITAPAIVGPHGWVILPVRYNSDPDALNPEYLSRLLIISDNYLVKESRDSWGDISTNIEVEKLGFDGVSLYFGSTIRDDVGGITEITSHLNRVTVIYYGGDSWLIEPTWSTHTYGSSSGNVILSAPYVIGGTSAVNSVGYLYVLNKITGSIYMTYGVENGYQSSVFNAATEDVFMGGKNRAYDINIFSGLRWQTPFYPSTSIFTALHHKLLLLTTGANPTFIIVDQDGTNLKTHSLEGYTSGLFEVDSEGLVHTATTDWIYIIDYKTERILFNYRVFTSMTSMLFMDDGTYYTGLDGNIYIVEGIPDFAAPILWRPVCLDCLR